MTANFLNLWGYCVDTLVIFQAKGVVQIPDHFVLQCWTKDANKFIEVSDVENNFDGQSTTSRILRRMHAQVKRDI